MHFPGTLDVDIFVYFSRTEYTLMVSEIRTLGDNFYLFYYN